MKNTYLLIVIIFLLLWFLKININEEGFMTEDIPSPIKIRGFSGNNLIKITWIKPNSLSEIVNYYIVLSSKEHPFLKDKYLKIYKYQSMNELLEYYIYNLFNDVVYDINIIAENENGNFSDISNTESIKPSKDSILDDENENKPVFSDSIQAAKLKMDAIRPLMHIPPNYNEDLIDDDEDDDENRYDKYKNKLNKMFNIRKDNDNTLDFILV